MEKQGEQILVVDIHLTRGLVALLTLAVAALVLVAYVTWGPGWVAASRSGAAPGTSSGQRQYYLTSTTRNGASALSACASGYHMASLWEILDPSHLKYNTTLGQTDGDSGQGPTTWPGWVRTGTTLGVGAMPGEGNCQAWTEDAAGASGTLAGLSWGQQDVHVWNTFTLPCNLRRPVWCVED